VAALGFLGDRSVAAQGRRERGWWFSDLTKRQDFVALHEMECISMNHINLDSELVTYR
jgi:hypothetical protein